MTSMTIVYRTMQTSTFSFRNASNHGRKWEIMCVAVIIAIPVMMTMMMKRRKTIMIRSGTMIRMIIMNKSIVRSLYNGDSSNIRV